MAILRTTEKAMMRAMCGVKVIEKRRSQELMSLLGSKDTFNGLARMRWYGNVLRRVLDFEVVRRRGRGRPNMTRKRQVDVKKYEVNPATCVNAFKTGVKKLDLSVL